jgi:hypothetical protein
MLGQEVLPFAAAIASKVQQISLLTAIRTGEIHPPMLARHLSTLDHLLHGRLTVNIINSELPGPSTNTGVLICVDKIRRIWLIFLSKNWRDNELLPFHSKIAMMAAKRAVVEQGKQGAKTHLSRFVRQISMTSEKILKLMRHLSCKSL